MLDKKAFVENIATQINERAIDTPLGQLQSLRQQLKSLKRRASDAPFHARTMMSNYAFHDGGRRELQFNIGFEGDKHFRHGLAFSFEPNQNVPDVTVLFPKVARFNEYLRANPSDFYDFLMWAWRGKDRIPFEQTPAPIAQNLIQTHMFVPIGRIYPIEELDVDLIVADLNRLLPLYTYVESSTALQAPKKRAPFVFQPGHRPLKPTSVRHGVPSILDVQNRHIDLQNTLYKLLCSTHGEENVRTEAPCGTGEIDALVREGSVYTLFEIKTASSARFCIREALSQLIEYAYWEDSLPVGGLVVVGEPTMDAESANYLNTLCKRFLLPISYMSIDIEAHMERA